jgi:hypothetical protein
MGQLSMMNSRGSRWKHLQFILNYEYYPNICMEEVRNTKKKQSLVCDLNFQHTNCYLVMFGDVITLATMLSGSLATTAWCVFSKWMDETASSYG